MLMDWIYDDGGRSRYFKGNARDCVCRSIAIVLGQDYKEIYNHIFAMMGESPRNGVNTRTAKFKRLMESLGFTWVATSGIGSHQAVHLVKGELPDGRLVCSMAGHYTAVVNNQVRDIIDPRTHDLWDYRKVYGYWKLKEI